MLPYLLLFLVTLPIPPIPLTFTFQGFALPSNLASQPAWLWTLFGDQYRRFDIARRIEFLSYSYAILGLVEHGYAALGWGVESATGWRLPGLDGRVGQPGGGEGAVSAGVGTTQPGRQGRQVGRSGSVVPRPLRTAIFLHLLSWRVATLLPPIPKGMAMPEGFEMPFIYKDRGWPMDLASLVGFGVVALGLVQEVNRVLRLIGRSSARLPAQTTIFARLFHAIWILHRGSITVNLLIAALGSQTSFTPEEMVGKMFDGVMTEGVPKLPNVPNAV